MPAYLLSPIGLLAAWAVGPTLCLVLGFWCHLEADCELQVFHTGIDGPQVDMDSSATRVVCAVPESIHRSARKLEIKKELERLRAENARLQAPVDSRAARYSPRGP